MSDMTTKAIFEEKISVELTENPDRVAGINAVYQFNVTGDNGGTYYVDLTGDAPAVAAGTAENANCTITAADSDFVDIVSGKLNGQMAFMTGKLKIAGDMGLALKLQKIIG
jgi:putative sterol carrier protein